MKAIITFTAELDLDSVLLPDKPDEALQYWLKSAREEPELAIRAVNIFVIDGELEKEFYERSR